jgi:aspartyl-tRNA(Asn)/glutamyl-tRNA(Gln) amidotransferase subunit C
MPVDNDTVRHIAKLAGLAVPEDRLAPLAKELDGILTWADMLGEVNVDNVPAMTSVVTQKLRVRSDQVTEADNAEALMSNAPDHVAHFFVVPKVVD